MKLPKRSQYPKEALVHNECYAISFVNKMSESPTGDAGECDEINKYIRINRKLSAGETFYTFIHELLHAADQEYKIKLTHRQIYKLEQAIGDYFLTNY